MRIFEHRKRSLIYHLRTLWLFTRSDLKTVVFPQTAFGYSAAFLRGTNTISLSSLFTNIPWHLPRIVFWIWLNLLGEVIANQRLSNSIIEDSINKPWRPLPSKRLTPDEARNLLLWILPVTYLVGRVIGGSEASVALMVLSYMYNDLGGANESWLVRNVLNACGLSSFSIGAAQVAAGPLSPLEDCLYMWVTILAVIITSTVQLQDLPDAEGDRARDRRTLQLVYGEKVARWSIAMPMLFWSLFCPCYWGLSVLGFLPSCLLGGLIATRVIFSRSRAADALTWKLWCLWMMVLYLLPLLYTVRKI
ncbi:UbiA prenyltransferase [Lindgomyces ingoldianus]|uniref:UbiA prenyltransferase n=1 Tax=Lindgomyces ingoldianus TaxID=673940 RepID=A0ACB6QVD9_9PLEO|nr:UbiA prenyltransferase [Lindgomyces ingoldianus]KAF2470543.1 UbiA prenyltransferase [Lindgomyces ingoldianus]